MDLFTQTQDTDLKDQPLALRLTPRTLDHFFGQEHLLGPGKLLRRAVEADRLGSVIFFGPSGSGKSALARLIALKTKAHFSELNAVTAGVADLRKGIEGAKLRKAAQGKSTILLVDEIHHFNKSQQDALLPDVERGTITLIGLTTENPYFYVNTALRSRSQIFEFFPHNDESLNKIIDRAITDSEWGLGDFKINVNAEARKHLINMGNGDARRILNALEIGVNTTRPDENGMIQFTLAVAEESVQRRALSYDKHGDEHYDTISAFIKSMRGGDPDAALYWMAKMIESGEDPRFIARRILICASEDVGNADPRALVVATAAFQAVELVGMPEGRIPLAQAATYVASAPKSNAAYLGVDAAILEVKKGKKREVPNHLKDANMDKEERGHGKGYMYPHGYPGHWIPQEYMPDPKVFYEPSDEGEEKKIKERLAKWRKK
ncbi:MAG: AAA family ATPase [Elusimicrobia bacterium RIFCSPLOWO2_01_FULL_54_10]|nr:MAG: AAA family ATPase [Elusimicrobia bacterium RIFCSPLOWO2_01_FULL_54_10]